MQTWKNLGAFIARHMVVIIPCGLALGIFFPDLFSWMRPAVPVLFAFMTFVGSLDNSLKELKAALTHPLPIVLILVFVHVVTPLVGYALGTVFFGYDPDIVCGIVLEYSVPVATSAIIWVSVYEGSIAIMLTTLLASTLITPFATPLTLQLLVGASVQVDVAGMFVDMLFMVAIPAIVALLLNEITHGWAAWHLAPVLSPASRITIPLIVTINTTSISAYILNLTPELLAVLVFIGCFAVANFFAGIGLALLFRLKRRAFVPVVFCCGMRNISAGAVIATQYFAPETIFPVMCGVLFQQVLAASFGKNLGRAIKHAPE
jgi:BASS family bile acid:Na+ symporter